MVVLNRLLDRIVPICQHHFKLIKRLREQDQEHHEALDGTAVRLQLWPIVLEENLDVLVEEIGLQQRLTKPVARLLLNLAILKDRLLSTSYLGP